MHLHTHSEIIKIINVTDSCGRVCKTTESDSSDSNGFDIIYIVVDDKTFPLKVSKNEKNRYYHMWNNNRRLLQ